ncbi:MAG: amino acid ABC transporter ATP-binding protein [Chloroflexota bacterium]
MAVKPDAPEIISINGLSKSYGTFQALSDIDLTVHEQEVIVIIGPSGSGKSTLIRCINGLERHQSGRIVVDGVELTGDHRRVEQVRRRVGMVFQSFNLFPHLTVMRNIAIGPEVLLKMSRAEAEATALELLIRVGLETHALKYPSQLSGGEQQRVAIARALAMQPKVLLCDEITSALDPEMINEVLLVIQELAESGMTMLIVSHEMNFANRVADRIVFMDKGQVVEEGPPAQLFTAPREERTKAFIGKILSASH